MMTKKANNFKDIAIYLKINREDDYSRFCIDYWLKVSKTLSYKCIVICDNEHLKEDIIELCQGCRFVTSKVYDLISSRISTPRWKCAANAHLTTFYDAILNGYESFWNIDADDTSFCLTVQETADLMKNVEAMIVEKNIDIVSLDMWRTLYWGGTGLLE